MVNHEEVSPPTAKAPTIGTISNAISGATLPSFIRSRRTKPPRIARPIFPGFACTGRPPTIEFAEPEYAEFFAICRYASTVARLGGLRGGCSAMTDDAAAKTPEGAFLRAGATSGRPWRGRSLALL